jgi:protein O-GlcNAc transferase
LGNTLLDLGQFHEAVAAYRNAVRFRPDFAIAYNHLGNALMSLRQAEAAILEYRRAIEIEHFCPRLQQSRQCALSTGSF